MIFKREQGGYFQLAKMIGPWLIVAVTPVAVWMMRPAPPPPQALQGSYGAPTGPCTPPLIDIDGSTTKIYFCGGDNAWHRAIPQGTIVMTLSACGTGWTELASMSGQFPQGTVAANSDVGTTGGSATQTFTTAGNVSLLGVGTALTGPTSINLSPPFTKIIFCQLP